MSVADISIRYRAGLMVSFCCGFMIEAAGEVLSTVIGAVASV